MFKETNCFLSRKANSAYYNKKKTSFFPIHNQKTIANVLKFTLIIYLFFPANFLLYNENYSYEKPTFR